MNQYDLTNIKKGPFLILDQKVNDMEFKGMKAQNNCRQQCQLPVSKDKNKFTKER